MLNEWFEFLIVFVEFLINQVFEGYTRICTLTCLVPLASEFRGEAQPWTTENPKDHKITI